MEYGLIGEHLSHSFSKEIHSYFADYDYEICELPPEKLYEFFKKKEFKGINVTIPYKKTVIPYLDEISEEAQKTGAVNTIINRNGRLYGFNTDYFGLKSLIEKHSVEIKNKSIYIFGTGGTSKTALAVVTDMGAESAVRVSRTPEKDEISYKQAEAEKKADIIINTTPCGMFPRFESTPLSPLLFPSLQCVIDAVYNPLNTELLLQAQKAGIKSINGLYMLVSQAVKSSGYFLDKAYPSSVIDDTYKKILNKKRNIVLTGMPGCGKTTVGKALAEITSKRFIDTDILIEKKENMTPSEIITKFGEDVFRQKEKEAIKSISLENGCIIATGGGSILKEENIKNLKRNGILVFLDRPPENIAISDSRPLSSSREKLNKLYGERIDIYNSVCDIKIEYNKTVLEIAEKIKEELL